MRLCAARKALAAAARTAAKAAAGSRLATPSLAGLHLEAMDGVVAVTGTDLEIGRRVEIEATVESDPAAVLVPAAFAKVVAAAQGDEVTVVLEGGRVVVSDGVTTWRLEPAGDPDDHPAEPSLVGEPLKISDWPRLQAVATMASRDQGRPILTGVLIGDGVAAATDSYRLAWIDLDTTDDQILVPARAIVGLDVTEAILRSDGRHVKATIDDGAWWARLIDGTFPRWRTLVSDDEPEVVVTVDAELLADVIKRSSLAADDHVPVFIGATGSGLLVSRPGKGSEPVFVEEVPARTSGPFDPVAFNAHYLTSIVAPVATIDISIVHPHKAVRFEGEGWWQGMLMPVKV